MNLHVCSLLAGGQWDALVTVPENSPISSHSAIITALVIHSVALCIQFTMLTALWPPLTHNMPVSLLQQSSARLFFISHCQQHGDWLAFWPPLGCDHGMLLHISRRQPVCLNWFFKSSPCPMSSVSIPSVYAKFIHGLAQIPNANLSPFSSPVLAKCGPCL